MITEKYPQQIWILLAESFSSVVSDLSYPLWFVKKLIFVGSYWTFNPAVTAIESPGRAKHAVLGVILAGRVFGQFRTLLWLLSHFVM